MAEYNTKVVIQGEDKTGPMFSSFRNNLKAADDSAGKFAATMGGPRGLNGLLAGFGVALSATTAIGFIKSNIDAADAMNDLALATGTTVKSLASIKLIAEQSGTGLESVGKSLNKLSIWMDQNATMAKKLGITAKDPIQAYAQLADALAGIEDPGKRARLAQEALGKAYMEQMPLLSQNGDAIRDAVAASSDYAEQMSKTAGQADTFNDSLGNIKQNISVLGIGMANDLLPLLNATASGMINASDRVTGLDGSFSLLTETLRVLIVLGGNISFVLQGVGRTLGGLAAQTAALASGNLSAVRAIQKQIIEDDEAARKSFDAWEKRLLDAGKTAEAVKKNIKKPGSVADPDAARGAEEAGKRAAAQYSAAAKAAEDYTAKLREETEAVGADAIQKKMLEAATKALHAPNDKLRMQIMQAAQAWAIVQEAIEAAKRQNEAFDEEFDAREKARTGVEGTIKASRERLEQLEFENSLVGLNNIEREKAIALYALEKQGLELNAEAFEQYKQRWQDALSNREAIKQSTEEQAGMWKSIEQTAHDTFVSILDGGKNFAQRLRDTLKNVLFDWLYQMTIKKWIIGIGASVSGSAVAGQAFGAQAAGSAGGGMMSSIASSAIGQTLGIGTLGSYVSTGFMNTVAGGAGLFGNTAAGLQAAGSMISGGSVGSGLAMGLGTVAPYIMAAIALYSILKKPGNEWDAISVNPDAATADRIKATHGKDALLKTASGLNLGATWKRTSGEQSKAALAAMGNIDSALFGITGANMTGKLTGTYGYNKKAGGFLAGDKTVGSMDEVMAQFTRDWVDAADTVQQINKDLVATVTGSAEEVLKKTVGIVAMTQSDMDKLFGEAITADKFKAVAKAGEGAGDAFARLAPIFASTGNLAKIMGADVATMFGAAGLASSGSREKLVKNAGGTDALNAQLGTYQDLYFSDAEKLQMATADVSAQFGKLGVTMPKTKAEFRTMMEDMAKSGKLATDEGSKLYAALLKLAPAFSAVTDSAAAAKQSVIDREQATVDAARANLQEAYNREAGALQQVIDKMGGFARAIKQFREGLLLGDLSPLSPLAKYDEARRRFDDVERRAALGDTTAMEELQAVSQAYLEASRAYNASNAQYVADFERVQQALSRTEGTAARQADIAQQQLAALNQQVAGLLDINKSVLSVADAIRDLQNAMVGLDLAKRPDVGNSPAAGGSRITNPAGVVQGRDGLRDANIAGIAWNGGNITDASVTAAISTGFGYGYSPAQVAAAWNAAHPESPTDATNIIDWAKTNNIAGYADGGLHTGGLRLVGERGWEIEATGPARYFTPEQLMSADRGDGGKETVAAIREAVAEIRASRQTQVDVGNRLDARLATIERRLDAIETDGRLRNAA